MMCVFQQKEEVSAAMAQGTCRERLKVFVLELNENIRRHYPPGVCLIS